MIKKKVKVADKETIFRIGPDSELDSDVGSGIIHNIGGKQDY